MNTRYIIGVVGTANTGKSTFINDVINDNSKFVLFGEDYRKKILKEGLQINRNGNERCQQIIHDTLVSNIKGAYFISNQHVIMDRTIIDSYVYTLWHKKYGTAQISDETLEKMRNDVLEYSKYFTHIIYLSLSKCGNVKVIDDKFRDTNLEYRVQIDGLMNEVITMLRDGSGPEIIDSIYGSREDRLVQFKKKFV